MLKGINLSIMVGPVVPVPVPKSVIDALTKVEVTVNSTSVSVFQLTFMVDANSPLNTLFLMSGGAMIPIIRVVLVLTINGQTEVLMDGVVTTTELQPGQNGGQSTLVVTGEDLTRVMDYIDFSGLPYPAMPPFTRVAMIIAKYAVFGIIPLTIPAILPDVPIPTDKIPAQKGKDLHYILSLAAEAGHVFYIEPGPAPLTNTAYWGPEIKVGVPQSALSINMDAHTNVQDLSFSIDSEYKKTPVIYIQEPITKATIPIPIPDVSPLNPPLGVLQPIAKNVEQEKESAKESPTRAAMIGLRKASQSSDAIKGEGTLDVLRYGGLLKARRLVGVRGAGLAFDGLYFVTSVKSTLESGKFTQSFSLSRNGLISITPNVPV